MLKHLRLSEESVGACFDASFQSFVLKDKITVCGLPRALTVLLAFGTQTLKSVPARTGYRNYVADKKAVKKTVSWAEIARK